VSPVTNSTYVLTTL